MTLEIQVNNRVTGSWGWYAAGGWSSYLNTGLGPDTAQILHTDWALDNDRQMSLRA